MTGVQWAEPSDWLDVAATSRPRQARARTGARTRRQRGETHMITVMTDEGEFAARDAEAVGDALWLTAREAKAGTGWELKEQGLCRDLTCVPLPPGREREWVRDGRVNVAATWRHLGRPVVHSERGHAWVLGQGAVERAATLHSLQAPDFTLPDPTGRLHSLSEQRGKKVLLVTWASW